MWSGDFFSEIKLNSNTIFCMQTKKIGSINKSIYLLIFQFYSVLLSAVQQTHIIYFFDKIQFVPDVPFENI
jgi:hypothetical protein